VVWRVAPCPGRFLIAALLGMTGVYVPAGPPAKAQDTVTLDVWSIRATTANRDVDADLKPLIEALKGFKFTGFKVERKGSKALPFGETFKTDLPGPNGYKAEVTPVKRDGERMTLKVKITQRKGGQDETVTNTTVTLDKNKFQLFAGMKLDKGDDLIVAVRAR
jgi:hypothetical protein